jgi:hypothetical protein
MDVECGQCHLPLEESPYLPAAERRPCPGCGSLSRQVNVSVSDTAQARGKVNLKGRLPGVKRPFVEQTAGDDFHRKTGRWMKLERVIDRVRDWYHERVTDPRSGNVVHECDEPLSQHRGHGSDLPKREEGGG